MSEFSDKLSEYIAKSGSNVYQLAKEASLDRTTLQKTAKGQRLPSLDYIREICQYIKISGFFVANVRECQMNDIILSISSVDK